MLQALRLALYGHGRQEERTQYQEQEDGQTGGSWSRAYFLEALAMPGRLYMDFYAALLEG
jgi:hypothetical protein